jgi:ribosome-binding factor A
MASRRTLKAAEAIREVVSMSILTEIRDPRIQNVTVTGVEVAPDMRSAKVLVSVMGDDGKQQLCIRGLTNSAGFLQSKIAKRIDTRYTPRLSFELDQGIKKSLEVGKILYELAQEREAAEQMTADQPDNILAEKKSVDYESGVGQESLDSPSQSDGS